MPVCLLQSRSTTEGDAAGAEEYEEEEEEEVEDDFSLHQAIRHCQLVREVEENMGESTAGARPDSEAGPPPAKRSKQSEESYFSDED